jgi:hypothetical protein
MGPMTFVPLLVQPPLQFLSMFQSPSRQEYSRGTWSYQPKHTPAGLHFVISLLEVGVLAGNSGRAEGGAASSHISDLH